MLSRSTLEPMSVSSATECSSLRPKVGMRKEVSRDIRTTFRAPSRQEADRYLKIAIEKYRTTASKLSDWMEKNIPEGLEVYQVPISCRRFLRTTKMVERQMKEIKRRTRVAMVFPNENDGRKQEDQKTLWLRNQALIECDTGSFHLHQYPAISGGNPKCPRDCSSGGISMTFREFDDDFS